MEEANRPASPETDKEAAGREAQGILFFDEVDIWRELQVIFPYTFFSSHLS
jgi:hypothetical protein